MIEKMLNRRSERSYSKKPVSNDIYENIIKIINSSPTSINAHGFSAIIVKDEETKKEISKLNWNQPHIIDADSIIIFVADLNRGFNAINNSYPVAKQLKEEMVHVGFVDSTIAATSVMNYLVNEDIGTCFIGGVRSYPTYLIEKLNLAPNMIPVVGLTVGHIENQNDIRPKFEKTFMEKYDAKLEKENVSKYDEIMKADYAKRNQDSNWTINTRNTYKNFGSLYDQMDELLKKIEK